MRGAFRGMFRFGCSSAYGPHSYSVIQSNQTGITGSDNIEFRSYLYSLISQAAEPRQQEKKRLPAKLNEIFPGVLMGPSEIDLTVIGVAFTLLVSVLLGGCFLLGWIVDTQCRDARLQYAQQYAQMHPNVAAEFGVPRDLRNSIYTSR